MATIELTRTDFAGTVSGDGIVLIDWWASWCGSCRAFAPIFEEASENHPDVTFAKIDTEAEQELSTMVGIQSIPTLMMFRDGVLLFSQAGALPAEALDTDEVRREIDDTREGDESADDAGEASNG